MKTFMKVLGYLVRHIFTCALLVAGSIIELLFAIIRKIRIGYIAVAKSYVNAIKPDKYIKDKWNAIMVDAAYNDMEEATKFYDFAFYKELKKGSN